MHGFAVGALLVAAAISFAPIPAGAKDDARLSATVPVTLVVLPGADIGVRASGSRAVIARDTSGNAFAAGEVEFRLSDSRGERSFLDASELQRALDLAERAGESSVDVTLVF